MKLSQEEINGLRHRVRESVRNHAGGVIFIKLVDELRTLETCKEFLSDEFSAELEKVIREMTDVKILDYTWHVSPSHRKRMFVYTP